MPFVEYMSRGGKSATANFIRIDKFNIKMSTDLWTEMGKPERVKFYYDEEKNLVGMKLSQNTGLKPREISGTMQVFWKGVLDFFKIVIEKPMSCKVIKEGSMFTFSLSNGTSCK